MFHINDPWEQCDSGRLREAVVGSVQTRNLGCATYADVILMFAFSSWGCFSPSDNFELLLT